MKSKSGTIEIAEIREETLVAFVVGVTPLILNEMSAKTRRELLMPAKKTRASRAGTLKHDVVAEFRNSIRMDHSADGPTRILFPSPAFRKAMQTAALDIPGATKAEIVRLTRIVGYSVPVFGIPRLRMDPVRSAGMNAAPDIRMRACLDPWCVQLEITYRIPNLNQTTIGNLLAAAGKSCGVGDYRQEKGSGDFGLFEVVGDDDPRVKDLIKNAGRTQQDEAIAHPVAYDPDTQDLWSWYQAEILRQGMKEAG